MTTVNFADLLANMAPEPAEFDLPGIYEMQVGWVKFQHSSNGNPMYVVQLVSTKGPTQHRAVKYYLVCSPNNPSFFFKKLADLGITADMVKQAHDERVMEAMLTRVGVVTVQLKPREYNGETYPDVAWARKPKQPQAQPQPVG